MVTGPALGQVRYRKVPLTTAPYGIAFYWYTGTTSIYLKENIDDADGNAAVIVTGFGDPIDLQFNLGGASVFCLSPDIFPLH